MSTVEMVSVSKADRDKWLARDLKAQLSARKASTKITIYVEKAKDAGIVVTKAEVVKRMAADDAKKASETAPASEEA